MQEDSMTTEDKKTQLQDLKTVSNRVALLLLRGWLQPIALAFVQLGK